MSYSVNMIHNIIPHFTNLFQEPTVGLNHIIVIEFVVMHDKNTVQIKWITR